MQRPPAGAETHCDQDLIGSFLLGSDSEGFARTGRRAKELAGQATRPELKTYGLFTIVPGETDKDAETRVDSCNAGADRVAMEQEFLVEIATTAVISR